MRNHSRSSRMLSAVNILIAILFVLTAILHLSWVRQGHIPGHDWGLTPAMWYQNIKIWFEYAVVCGAMALGFWYLPRYTSYLDSILIIPKLWLGYEWLGFAFISGNIALKSIAFLVVLNALLLFCFWRDCMRASGAAKAQSISD